MYLVTAYRWGCTNLHQYQVYCGPDRTKAEALAQNECSDRGGKYGVAVCEWNADGTSHKRIGYFPDIMNGGDHPFHNYRIDYLESLGHFLDAYGKGDVLLPNAAQPGTLKRTEVDKPPQFVLDEIERRRKQYDMMTEIVNRQVPK